MTSYSRSRPAVRDPAALKSAISDGLLSFPLTDFNADLSFNADAYRRRLEWLVPFGASALFAAGGTGEFSSLAPREFRSAIETAVSACAGRVPILAGAGGGHAFAVEFAREAEAVGAAGVLLLPHYLTDASQAGLGAHVRAVCDAVRIGVIVYNRGPCRLAPATLERLAGECSNLIGFKGRHRRHRVDGRDSPPPRGPVRLRGRPADGRSLCARVSSDGRERLLVGGVQLRTRDRDRLLPRCAGETRRR